MMIFQKDVLAGFEPWGFKVADLDSFYLDYGVLNLVKNFSYLPILALEQGYT
jgi:hypothetical protein